MADSRLMMNIKGISSAFIPRIFFQSRLKSIFKELLSLDTKTLDNILSRVHFYNQINKDFSKDFFDDKEKCKINLLPFSKTSYAFDAYKITKFFDDDFLWVKNFQDVHWIFDKPTLCKSRPIDPNNQNNILLKLDSNRHFCFFKDFIKFEDKQDKAVFRGACFQPLRIKFFEKHKDNKNLNIANILRRNSYFKRKNYLNKKAQCQFKFIISLEGNDVSSNLKWAMYSNSLVLAPKMTCESWFMESKLIPNVHFALINDDFSNVNDLIEYYLNKPSKAQEIIKNAHLFCEQFFDKKIEFFIGILVFLKYFYYSGQIKNKDFDEEVLNLIKI